MTKKLLQHMSAERTYIQKVSSESQQTGDTDS